ncbi:MAG: hypothetical protein OMM_02415 [Candidatus Magnetoglobus multicellularis str. Araruama]|uniref:ATPase domain protein, prokaryote domain protein n=1 Tax=Candidatus Magnetoglobus multicellularis str. Araruama TaxID=890399 RepID=A0A1V1PA33_9BACT|nr:MAG: hypothetical protein OMM_02415 [Candidatus Magnetoglobus multicellularis str. Araruama]
MLRLDKNNRWEIDSIEFAIKERVGKPENFIGRIKELEFLYTWADNIRNEVSRSIAFLGRRKIGKSLILERLYNIIYSENMGLIPFYYELTEGTRSGKEFYHDFITRFYMQIVGYYTRDISLIREAVDTQTDVKMERLVKHVQKCSIPHKAKIEDRLYNSIDTMKTNKPLYEYVIAATAAPRSFATIPDVQEKIVQMIDEFQYLNMYIDAGDEDKPCKAYMSTAEMKVAPLLITGSLMGVVSEELMRWLPQRFYEVMVPKMDIDESIAMTLNYSSIYGQPVTREVAQYIVHITNNVPGRIVELLTPNIHKSLIRTIRDADQALNFEVNMGNIKKDWDEYLNLAMNAVNDINMRQITFFLCKHEGKWFYPIELKQALSLQLDDKKLREELTLLHKYDLIEMSGGKYGGVFDRTLKKVLMTNYGDILQLPEKDFDAYFRNDSLLDYLKERIKQLELSLEEAHKLRSKLKILQGNHNHLKGHYYEHEVLLSLIKSIIDKNGGLTDGISVTDFSYKLRFFLETQNEIDIILESKHVVIMAECKNYAPENIYKITQKMVENFADKARQLAKDQFHHKDLRLGYFSKHGFVEKMTPVFDRLGIVAGS